MQLIAFCALLFAVGANAFAVGPSRAGLSHVGARTTQRAITMDDKQPLIKTKSGLGRTVDQDGKSNVWAVEPKVRVEKSEFNLSDPKVLAGVGAVILAVVAIPLFPAIFSGASGQY